MVIRVQVQVTDDVLRSLFAQTSVQTELKDRPLQVGLYQDLAQKALMIQVWRAQVGKAVLRPHAVYIQGSNHVPAWQLMYLLGWGMCCCSNAAHVV